MKKLDFFLIILMSCLVISVIVLFLLSPFSRGLPYSIKFKTIGYSENSVREICSDKNLEETSYCLNAFVKGVFNYEDVNPKTINELIEKGGVCRDYNNFYKKMLHNFGFKTNEIMTSWRIGKDESWNENDSVVYLGDGYNVESHVYLTTNDINSSDITICTLDQTYVNCRNFN